MGLSTEWIADFVFFQHFLLTFLYSTAEKHSVNGGSTSIETEIHKTKNYGGRSGKKEKLQNSLQGDRVTHFTTT